MIYLLSYYPIILLFTIEIVIFPIAFYMSLPGRVKTTHWFTTSQALAANERSEKAKARSKEAVRRPAAVGDADHSAGDVGYPPKKSGLMG